MKIVIDIDDRLYNRIKYLEPKADTMLDEFMRSIQNGIPLPKGCGDLIDRKDLIENGISKGFCDWYDEIKMADTIIEAEESDPECRE